MWESLSSFLFPTKNRWGKSMINLANPFKTYVEKSRIWETLTLSTDADSRTDTILEKLRDQHILIFLFNFFKDKYIFF